MAEGNAETGSTARTALWTLFVLLLAVFAVWGPAKMIREANEDEPAIAEGDEVHMAGFEFAPATLVVASGTEVRFINDDVAPHDVTEVGGGDRGSSAPGEAGEIASGNLAPGDTFTLVVDRSFDYFCTLHPFMTARVEVR